MNKKSFQKFLDRDTGCVHCGINDDTLIPHHRQNRGMGGSKLLDKPSNIVVLCSGANNWLESNYAFAQMGKDYGWKLTHGQEPEKTPVWIVDGWYLLDNEFGKVKVKHANNLDPDYN